MSTHLQAAAKKAALELNLDQQNSTIPPDEVKQPVEEGTAQSRFQLAAAAAKRRIEGTDAESIRPALKKIDGADCVY